MIETQKQAYGDGLDPDLSASVYVDLQVPLIFQRFELYNFPYAFGALFARDLGL